jgi:hypothetical protein
MESVLLLAGLGLSLAAALVLAVTDAWLARSMLIYLDAVEANVAKIAHALRAGGTEPTVTGFNIQRDQGQDRARAIKTLAWFVLAAGLALQFAAACLAKLAH